MALPSFNLEIVAETFEVEAYRPQSKWTKPALHFSFDGGRDQPLSLSFDKIGADQCEQIAAAINAILNGDTVQIIPSEE